MVAHVIEQGRCSRFLRANDYEVDMWRRIGSQGADSRDYLAAMQLISTFTFFGNV
jgi:hypothetical protein